MDFYLLDQTGKDAGEVFKLIFLIIDGKDIGMLS
jgi:hypothetical protein